MKKFKIISIHVFGWLVILSYQHLGYLIDAKSFSHMAFGLSMSLIRIIEFYICYLWVYPSFLKKGKALQLVGAVTFTLAIFIALRYLIEEVLYMKWFGFHNYSDDTTWIDYILDNIYYGSSYIAIAAAAFSIEQNFKTESDNRKLKEEVVKSELAFLKSQINPHFLYNTLNYIYALAIPVSDKLSVAVLKLSDLMRYTLSESADGRVGLDKEVEYLQSYIDLFKMRFEPNFHVDFESDGIDGQRIAALLLIPFVENAFKHGVVNEPGHPIRIKLQVRHKRLSFEVSNKISRAQKDYSSGVGLVNIHRRLDLIYPDRHELLISNNGNTYKTTLIINL